VEIADATPGSVARTPVAFLPLTDQQGQVTGVLGVVIIRGCRWLGSQQVQEADALRARLHELRRDLPPRFDQLPLLGDSLVIRRVREQLALAAESRGRVLVVGHAESGRDDVARAIHFREPAKQDLLVTVDGRVVDAEEMQRLLTSFLRQRQRAADGANRRLLLLNADRLSTTAAAELSGFLKLPQVDFPLLATAERSLESLAKRGKFPAALAVQLSVLTIRLPKLRERAADIPLLCQRLVENWNRDQPGHTRSGFTSAALDDLAEYEWPGELPELQAAVFAACQQAQGPRVEPHDLPPVLRLGAAAIAHPSRQDDPIDLDQFLAGVEKELIHRALTRTKNNKSKAAELLGMNRARLLRRLAQLGLAAPEDVVFKPISEETDRAD